MQIATLTGKPLDYLIAVAEGYMAERIQDGQMIKGNKRILVGVQPLYTSWGGLNTLGAQHAYSPSTDWAVGGEILERLIAKGMRIFNTGLNEPDFTATFDDAHSSSGSSVLLAAMRCYAEYEFGEEVHIPKEITCG